MFLLALQTTSCLLYPGVSWYSFFLCFSKQSTFCHRLSMTLHDIFYVFLKIPETDVLPVSYCKILSGKTKTPRFMQDKYLRKYFVHLRFHVDLNQQFLSWKSSSPSLIYNRKRKNTQQLQHYITIPFKLAHSLWLLLTNLIF